MPHSFDFYSSVFLSSFSAIGSDASSQALTYILHGSLLFVRAALSHNRNFLTCLSYLYSLKKPYRSQALIVAFSVCFSGYVHLFTYTWVGISFSLLCIFIVSAVHSPLGWVKSSQSTPASLQIFWRIILPGLRLQIYLLFQIE